MLLECVSVDHWRPHKLMRGGKESHAERLWWTAVWVIRRWSNAEAVETNQINEIISTLVELNPSSSSFTFARNKLNLVRLYASGLTMRSDLVDYVPNFTALFFQRRWSITRHEQTILYLTPLQTDKRCCILICCIISYGSSTNFILNIKVINQCLQFHVQIVWISYWHNWFSQHWFQGDDTGAVTTHQLTIKRGTITTGSTDKTTSNGKNLETFAGMTGSHRRSLCLSDQTLSTPSNKLFPIALRMPSELFLIVCPPALHK